jgi:glycine cleavage system aminomethyltransferase T
MIQPSPFIASILPNEGFDPLRHIAFGDVFLEKYMSKGEDEKLALTQGAGLPDRGDQGWVSITGEQFEFQLEKWFDSKYPGLIPGHGICGITITEICDDPIDIYCDSNRQFYINAPRTSVSKIMTRFKSHPSLKGCKVVNESKAVGRMAIMGPSSNKLIKALGGEPDQLPFRGCHEVLEIILEPVRICRSDFAGSPAYDLIIPIEPFTMVIAAICSWGVRLEMNLLPVGWCVPRELSQLSESKP